MIAKIMGMAEEYSFDIDEFFAWLKEVDKLENLNTANIEDMVIEYCQSVDTQEHTKSKDTSEKVEQNDGSSINSEKSVTVVLLNSRN